MAKKPAAADLHRDLLAARERGTPVRVERDELEDAFSVGLVVGASRKLVLLQQVSERIRLDGFEVLRLDDVTELKTKWPGRRFVERALELKGQHRGSPNGPIDLAGMREAIRSADAAYPLIVVHREAVTPGEPAIGRIRQEVRGAFALHWMSPQARWQWGPERYRWPDVTRLEFGNEYEQTLAMVAEADGARPPAAALDEVWPPSD